MHSECKLHPPRPETVFLSQKNACKGRNSGLDAAFHIHPCYISSRMSLSAATLLLPSQDAAWRLWKPRSSGAVEQVESPADCQSSTSSLVIGLPASACRSLGLILPMAEHELLGQMVETQLERQGLRAGDGGLRPHRWHLLGQQSGMAVISVDVLADPFPDHLTVNHASDYVAALRLLDLPENQLVVVEEQGELVVAYSYHGRLFRSHIFAPAGAAPEEVATELRVTRLALEAQPVLGQIEGVTLVGRGWEADRIGRLLDLPVRVLESLPRAGQLESARNEALLPVSVRQAREQARRRAKLLRHGILGALLYAALVFLGFAYLNHHEKRAAELRRQVDLTTAPAAAVKKTAEAWKALAPALDTNRYPMVLMAEITSLMPPSGIVLREFDGRLADIELRGEARDAQLAYQFLEDLQKHRVLGRYTWSMPQPSVREKTASFRAQGKLK